MATVRPQLRLRRPQAFRILLGQRDRHLQHARRFNQKLRALDGYIIVGGFSYEDRSRAGIIAALDPVMQEIKLQSEAGKPILGICNGAQILVETGLVPGLENNKL
ncbi:MAG: hypothetical protein EBU34_07075, partial [Alphaproteobacteria bacterium]|nr:hypothetical protein [Alphaproteobacteria bacterium]